MIISIPGVYGGHRSVCNGRISACGESAQYGGCGGLVLSIVAYIASLHAYHHEAMRNEALISERLIISKSSINSVAKIMLINHRHRWVVAGDRAAGSVTLLMKAH